MKLKYILTLVAGALVALASCKQEDPISLDRDGAVQLNPSISLFDKDGGSATVDVKAIAAWKASTNADWVTVEPASGSGDAKVTVTVAKNPNEKDRQAIVQFTAGGGKMNLTVKQEAGGVKYGTAENPYPASKAYEFAAALDADAKSDEVYITGIISQIVEKFGTEFGNATFYITDDGKTAPKMFEVYRALYIGNKKYDNVADKNINVGDVVVVCGKCTNYKGNTPETVQGEAYVVSIEEGSSPVLACGKPEITVVAGATSASFDIDANNLSGGWTATTDASWITDYTKSGTGSGKLEVSFDANTVEQERTATFTVSASGVEDLTLTLTQGAFSPIQDATTAEVKTKEDNTDDLFRVTGVVTRIVMDNSDPTHYNLYGNFDITDETGTLYVYGLLPEAGGATKQDVLTNKGVKLGDVITVVGPKSSYNGDPQMKNAYYESHTPVTATTTEAFNALADGDDLYMIKGAIRNIVMDKNDPTIYNKYGNFDVVDEAGSTYVYGIVPMGSKKGGQDILTTLGVKEGDIVTVVGPKSSYNGSPQMKNGFLVSVEPGTPGPQDNFDYTPSAAYNAAGNLWKAVDAAKAVEFFYYLNPNWSGEVYNNVASTECPYVEFKESTYKLTQEYATYSRWENQFYIHPYGAANYIALDPAKTYKFSVTLQSTESFGAFFKLSQYNPDGAPKYEGAAIWEPAGYPDNVVFEAGKPLVFENEISGVEAPNVNIVFDFGGAPEGAVIYIKDIIISEVSGDAPVSIAIDGDMSEWAAVSNALVSEEGPYLVFKGTADADYIYLYSKRSWHEGLWKDSSGGYFYYEFDLDNNPETGLVGADVVNGNKGFGVEAWMYLYLFTGTSSAPTFASNPAGSGYPSSGVLANVTAAGYTDGSTVIETEVRIPRADIGATSAGPIRIYSWGNKSASNLKSEESYLVLDLK